MSIGSFWIGDIPGTALRVEPIINGVRADLALFTGVSAALYLGSTLIEPGLTATLDAPEDEVVLSFPETSPFAAEGLYRVRLTLTNTGVSEQSAPEYILVQNPATQWYTTEDARSDWPDAPQDDGYLYRLLQVAGEQVIEYAPAFTSVGENLRAAQLGQARALWTANRANQADQLGSDIYPVRVFPMDWTIKNLIRPKRGVPAAW